MSKTAVITGVTGQDGSHLADLLLEKGYIVVGLMRRTSTEPPSRMRKHLWENVIQFPGDVTDSYSIESVLKQYQPDEFYNLAAQSHVGTSWKQPEETSRVDYFGVLNILKGIQLISPHTRFYQASTSEMFGKVEDEYQNEKSRFYPRSPYAVAKLAAYWLTVNYRESYGLFACSGILFNHEGPRRGRDFVTRKITDHVAKYKLGKTTEPLQLGNLNSISSFQNSNYRSRTIISARNSKDLNMATLRLLLILIALNAFTHENVRSILNLTWYFSSSNLNFGPLFRW